MVYVCRDPRTRVLKMGRFKGLRQRLPLNWPYRSPVKVPLKGPWKGFYDWYDNAKRVAGFRAVLTG